MPAHRFDPADLLAESALVPDGPEIAPKAPDFASAAALLRDLPRVKLRELHCHPDVAEKLRALQRRGSLPEAGPPSPWSATAGRLTAIPVIEKPKLGPGCWELLEDGIVVQRCFRGPDGELYVCTGPPLPEIPLDGIPRLVPCYGPDGERVSTAIVSPTVVPPRC